MAIFITGGVGGATSVTTTGQNSSSGGTTTTTYNSSSRSSSSPSNSTPSSSGSSSSSSGSSSSSRETTGSYIVTKSDGTVVERFRDGSADRVISSGGSSSSSGSSIPAGEVDTTAYEDKYGYHPRTYQEMEEARLMSGQNSIDVSSAPGVSSGGTRVPLTQAQVEQYNQLASTQESYTPLEMDSQGNYYYPRGSAKEKAQEREALMLSQGYKMKSTTKSDVYVSPKAEELRYNSNLSDLVFDNLVSVEEVKGGEYSGLTAFTILAPEGTNAYATAENVLENTPKGTKVVEISEGKYLYVYDASSETTTSTSALAGPVADHNKLLNPKWEVGPPEPSNYPLAREGMSLVTPNVLMALDSKGMTNPMWAPGLKEYMATETKDTVFGLATFLEETFPERVMSPERLMSKQESIAYMQNPNISPAERMQYGMNPPVSSSKTAWTLLAVGGMAVSLPMAPAEISMGAIATQMGIGGGISLAVGQGARMVFAPTRDTTTDVENMTEDFLVGAGSTAVFMGVTGVAKPIIGLQPGLAGEVGKRVVVAELGGFSAGYSYSAMKDIYEDKPVDTDRAMTYGAYGVIVGGVVEGASIGMEKGVIPRPRYVDKTWSTTTENQGVITTQEYSYRGLGYEWKHVGHPVVGVQGGGGWSVAMGTPNVYRQGVTAYPMAFTPIETAIFKPAYTKYYSYLKTISPGERDIVVKQLMEYSAGQPNKEIIVDYFMPKQGGLGVASTRWETGQEMMYYVYSNTAPQRLNMGLQDVIRGSPLFQKEGVPETLMRVIKTEKPVVYGSMSQKAMEGDFYGRTVMDIDLISPRPEYLASKFVKELTPYYGAQNVRISPESASLVELNMNGKWIHALDIHSSYGSATAGVLDANYIGFGMANKPYWVTKEGYPMISLQEQGARKLSSALSPTAFGPGPEAHRLKDVYGGLNANDFFATGQSASGQSSLTMQRMSTAFKNTIPANVQKALEISGPASSSFAIYPSVYYTPLSSATSPGVVGILSGVGKTTTPSYSSVKLPEMSFMSTPPKASPSSPASSGLGKFLSSPSPSPYKSPKLSPYYSASASSSPKVSMPSVSIPKSPSYSPPYSPTYSPPYSPPSSPPYSPPSSPPYSPPSSPPYSPPSSPPSSPPYSPPSSPPYTPPKTPPVVAWPIGMDSGPAWNRGGHSFKMKNVYKPSYVGSGLAPGFERVTISKLPKTLTGGEIRGVLVKKKKGKGKKTWWEKT